MTSAAFIPPPLPGGVLVASPSSQICDQVVRKLEQHGPVHMVSGGAEALAKLEKGPWQVLFLDRQLPDLDAEELAAMVGQRHPGMRVVMIESATDIACLPAISHWTTGKTASESASASVPIDAPLPGMIGGSEPMREVYRMARLVARRDTTVLITGPTGSGKDLVARAIHQLSGRAANNFSVLNCAAIPETLIESELFGFARGAFTGASQPYAGRILAAQGGTLFLDEVGDLPLPAQAKLLRFLEQKEVQRLGSAETVKVDVRVVAATNHVLADAVERGVFRQDLYFRLSAFPIRLAPLEERGSDILQLASYFLRRLRTGANPLRLDAMARDKIESHSWPGNVRELQQVLERAEILSGGAATISAAHIAFGLKRKTD